MKLECPTCKSKTHRVIDYIIKSEIYITCYRCTVCQMVWNIGRSLISDGDWYRTICFKKKTIPLHRFVYERYYNEILNSNDAVHHINSIKRDNRPKNLLRINKTKHDGNKDLHYIKLNNKIHHLENIICSIKEGKLNVEDVDTSGFRGKIKNQ